MDQHGNVLDVLVRPKRDTRAAVGFFRRLLKDMEYVPRVVVTDKLRSCGAARRQAMPVVEHRTPKYPNNRAETTVRLAVRDQITGAAGRSTTA